jgi:hypothetical protein
MNYDKEYREWISWPSCKLATHEVEAGTEELHFYREKKSHVGIGKLSSIKKLFAKQVNQDFLNEIQELSNLEHLEMEVVTAADLRPLKKLSNLRILKITNVRTATDFTPLLEISSLTKLFIENAKFLDNLAFLSNAHNLIALGVEGGMYKKQKIDSLLPLSGLAKLEALFMSSVQLNDKNLDYLSLVPKLSYLSSARFAPESNFTSLRNLMPSLVCNWCESYNV